MGTLFKLLRNEILSLGMLFFVIVPFVGTMINDENAPAGVKQAAYKAESLFQGSIDGFNIQTAGLSGLSSGGGRSGAYISGRPIFIPGS